MYFSFQFCILQLFGYSLYFLTLFKISWNFSPYISILFLRCWIFFMNITLNCFLGRLTIPTSLNSSGVLLCSAIWYISLCCPILNFYLYIYVCKLVTFLDSGEVVLCRRCSLYPSSIHHSSHPRARGQLLGSDLCLQIQFHRLWNQFSCFWCLPPSEWRRSRGLCRIPGLRGQNLPTNIHLLLYIDIIESSLPSYNLFSLSPICSWYLFYISLHSFG